MIREVEETQTIIMYYWLQVSLMFDMYIMPIIMLGFFGAEGEERGGCGQAMPGSGTGSPHVLLHPVNT